MQTGGATTELKPQPTAPPLIVQQGRLLDFIDGGTQRKETPEEYVRQEIAKSLVREYGYLKAQIAVEFSLRVGSGRPRADLAIFEPGAPQAQDRARALIECKAETDAARANFAAAQDRARALIECKSHRIKAAARKDGVGPFPAVRTS